MQVFAALGTAVERGWARTRFDLDRLPAIAADVLRAADLRRVDPIAWAEKLASRAMPQQLPVLFGDAQVTAWRGHRVLVQLIYWLDETTAIHQHGFAGAFRVLAGSSLHTSYRFAASHTAPGFRFGRLERTSQEVLSRGDTREIGGGRALIHNLIHLEFPSVTIAIRTPWREALAPQWVFHPPGVAFDPKHEDVELRTRLRLFEVCERIDGAIAMRAARSIIARGQAAAWQLLVTVSARASDAELAPFSELVRRRHGELLVDAIGRLRVRGRVFALRDTTTKREHRALLALLADGAGRRSVLDAIRRLAPGRPPGERIERWLRELARPLGLSLDRSSARLLRRVVEGIAPHDIAVELGGYSVRDVSAIARAFARSPLFAPLVTASEDEEPNTSRSR